MKPSILYIVMGLGLLMLIAIGAQNTFFLSPDTMGPRFYMQVVVSLVVLLSALYVLVFQGGDKKWAAGIVGTIVGYWLPG